MNFYGPVSADGKVVACITLKPVLDLHIHTTALIVS